MAMQTITQHHHAAMPAPTETQMSRVASMSDASEDEYMPPESCTPAYGTPQPMSPVFSPLQLLSRATPTPKPLELPAPAEAKPEPLAPEPSVLDLTAQTHLRHVDGTVLSNNAAVRVVRLPASVETIGDDFAAGCPRLRKVDVSRCARLRSVGARFFAGSGAPLAGALALDLSGCGALRSIGAEFAADSEASVIVLPAGLARVGPGFAARPAGGTPLVDVSRCGAAVAHAIAAQPAEGGVGRRVVRFVQPRRAMRRQSLVGFTVTSLQALVVYFVALAFKLLVAASRLVFGTTFW